MIDLTVARIAEIVGGRLADITRNRPPPPTSRRRWSSTPRADPGGLLLARSGARTDGHDFADAAVAAGMVVARPPARSGSRRSSCPGSRRGRPFRALEHDASDGSGAAVLAALAALPPRWPPTWSRGVADRRHHRLLGKTSTRT